VKTRSIKKFIAGAVGLCLFIFVICVVRLKTLALEGNRLFEYRCQKVNPLLIGYKNSFLKFADYLKSPNKYSDEEVKSFLDGYMGGMKGYIDEENKWLVMQRDLLDRWDFKLLEPWYIQRTGEYQWKMYEAYRDDAKALSSMADNPDSGEKLMADSKEARERISKYSNLYFDAFNQAVQIKDWRKFFGRAPEPNCREEDLVIPDTSGAIDRIIPTPTPEPGTPMSPNG